MRNLKISAILICYVILLNSCYVMRAYRNRNLNLKDLDKFASIQLNPSPEPFIFPYNLGKITSVANFLDTALLNTGTYSFLIIKNDSIVYEKYFDQITVHTKQPSFSIAKSFIGTMVQMAVQDGFIKSLQEPITNYLTQLGEKDNKFKHITIQHLMNMSSGIKSSEDYSSPFSDVLHLGYTNNLKRLLKKIKMENDPGRKFDYKSVNTQLLASIVEAATKQKIQDYFIKKIWNPLGMEHTATWNIDSKRNNTPRAFCCINATTKDFAKLGKLYLNYGNYNGNQLLDRNFVLETTVSDSMAKNSGYKNQWWGSEPQKYFTDSLQADAYCKKTPGTKPVVSINNGKKYFGVYHEIAPFYAQGILEQFIYVNPRNNMIVVRLGHNWKNKKFSCLNFIEAIGNLGGNN